VIDIYRANQVEWSQMVSAILEKIRKWNATVMIEVNSIGDVIFEQVKKNWSDTHPFVTSSKSKQEIIEGLILDFNEYSVLLPGKELFPPLTQELETFTYTYNPKTRNISYGHANGLHDDTVMSLAISNYCRKTKKTLGSYSYVARKI
jgi:hypothetical protein